MATRILAPPALGILLLVVAGAFRGQPEPEPAILEAAELIEAGRKEQAALVLNEFLAARPWDAGAFHQVGSMWLVAGEPERALPHLEGAVSLAPDFVDGRLALGQALGQLEEVEDALHHLEAAATTDPSRFEAPYLAAAVLDRAGQLSAAVEAARRAVELAPEDPTIHRFFGRLLLRIEHWPEAEAALERALQLGYREDPAIFADLGAALLGQERLDLARIAYERHLEFAPEDAETLLQLGYIEWRAEEHDAARERLEQAIALDPGLRRAHHFLGLTQLRRGELEGAEASFRRALERDPAFPEAWVQLGKIALRRGDAGEAADLLETAIRHGPDFADAWYQLSFARRRLGDPEGAAAALARFEELRDTAPEPPRR